MVMELPATLLGRYELEEVVGVGGMGTVVRAHDAVLDRTVAIKLLRPEFSTEKEMVERFRREARIAAALSHPGIAQVYDFAEEGGRLFIVMEYLQGEDLQSLLSRQGSIEARVASAIGADCAEALEVAHEYGAVHRDVKPANIFLTTNGTTKLTDFGIARAASQAAVTVTGSVIGTSMYISPEQATGGAATPSGDIYSLGCVLFEMLTGRAPFQAESQVAVALAHVTEAPPKVTELNRRVPKEFDQIIAMSMAKAPDERFSSAGEMGAALRRLAKGVRAPATAGGGVDHGADQTQVVTPPVPRADTQKLPAAEATPLQAKEAQIPPARRSPRRGRRRVLAVAALAVLIALLWASRLIAPERSAETERTERTVKVPNFVGLSFDRAQVEARELGLTVNKVDKPSERPVGEVVEQEPEPGTVIRTDVVVKLAVSIGPREKVPNVTNLQLEGAKELLEKQGFVVKVDGSGDGEATVISQNPEADAEVPPGTEIVLTTEQDRKRGKGRGGDD